MALAVESDLVLGGGGGRWRGGRGPRLLGGGVHVGGLRSRERESDGQVRERQDGAALRSGREVMMSSFTDTDDGCDWPVQSSSSSYCLDPALPPRTFTNDVRNVAAC